MEKLGLKSMEKLLPARYQNPYLCRPEKCFVNMRILSVIATASETKREARIGSSAVENQCDDGALDFWNIPMSAAISGLVRMLIVFEMRFWIGSSVG